MELLHESGEELNITLWNECLENQEKFNPEFLNTTSTKTVFAITALKVTKYEGNPNLNSSSATHVYRNPVIPNTETLIQRLESDSFPSTVLAVAPVTVEELKEMSYSAARGKTFSIQATIDRFTCNESWFSVYCSSCDTAIPKKGNDWFCITHGIPKSHSYSFTITAVLNAINSTHSILISDETMNKMCNHTCQYLVVDLGYDDRKEIPLLLDRCRFGTYTFHVQLVKWSKPDNVRFVAIDVKNERSLEPASSSLILTPPPNEKETPTSAPSKLMLQSTEKISSARRQIIYEDDEENTPSGVSGKKGKLSLKRTMTLMNSTPQMTLMNST